MIVVLTCSVSFYVQQSESVLHIYPLLLDFLPIEVTRAWSRVPCAIQQVLISYLFYIVIQSPNHVWLFATPQTAARQASLSLTIGVCPSSRPLNQWCHPTISSSVALFTFCLQSFPASVSFPMSQLFASGAQTIGASATVLPKSIQDWFPLRLIGLISLLSKGLSTVFSSTTVRKHQSLGVLPSVLSSSHMSVHDYEKDHSLDNMNLCKQSNVFTF